MLTQKSQREMKNTVEEKGLVLESMTRGHINAVRRMSSEKNALNAASAMKIVSETLIMLTYTKIPFIDYWIFDDSKNS